MKAAKVAIVLLALYLCTELTQSANILAVFSYTFSTPFLVGQPYMKGLIDRGHNVTIISPVQFLPDIKGARHIRVLAVDEVIHNITNYDFDPDFMTNRWKGALVTAGFYHNITEGILNDLGVQALLKDESEHFDMVILEPTFTDALIGIAEHFNAPHVGFSAYGSSWLIDYLAGNSAPSVYRPISPMGFSQGETLLDKWNNWMHIVEEWMMDRFVYLPEQLEVFRRYFPFPAKRLYERRRNFSLMLINQHFSLGRVKSNAPNVIEVGGLHMAEPSTPLEPELLDFINKAEHGVIYFSMGLEILTKYLPENVEQKLVQTFSHLKQRVVWKHEVESMINQTDNILFCSRASQRQLLEHPNVKLFITHGGLLSLMEAAYAGVPMLGFPIYFDQFDNVERMRQAGVSLTVDFSTFTVEQLTQNIKELLENPIYLKKAKELSARVRDQPTSPLERALWWTEYVLRHNGAHHLRVAEHDMAFVPYYGIQFIAILCIRIGFPAIILIIAAFMFFKFVLKEIKKIFKKPLIYNALETSR